MSVFTTGSGSRPRGGRHAAESGQAAGEALQISAGGNPVSGASAGTYEVKTHILWEKFPSV